MHCTIFQAVISYKYMHPSVLIVDVISGMMFTVEDLKKAMNDLIHQDWLDRELLDIMFIGEKSGHLR